MPTENLSSNTEMVSVKRELVEQAMQACFEAGFGIPHDALRDVLAQPAHQPQGEPVALPERKAITAHGLTALDSEAEGWNACLDEIAKLGPLYTRPVQGEPVAWQDPDNDSRMCTAEHKAYALSKGGAPAAALATLTRPLYTHADPGEVERIENERAEQWRLRRDAEADRDTKAAVIAELRAQLAERDVLLREVLVGLWPSTPLAIKINAAVSGSAAPGGSQHKLAMDAACGEIEVLRAQLTEAHALLRDFCAHSALICGDLLRLAREVDLATTAPIRTRAYSAMDHARKVRKTISASAEPSASVAIRCSFCNATDAEGNPWSGAKSYVDGRLIYQVSACKDHKHLADAVRQVMEPSAPVERDERAEFDAAYERGDFYLAESRSEVQHQDYRKQQAWAVWQVRAALERKP